MEPVNKSMTPNDHEIYEKAKKRVDAIKGFHSHIKAYIVVNTIILLIRANVLSMFKIDTMNLEFERWLEWNTWGTVMFWGIGLLLHGLYVYRFNFGFIKRWEQRKIREILEKEEEDTFKTNR
jgi:hypothetical protein